jgi:hypothetical protein
MRLLTKQGFLIAEQDRTYLAEADGESALEDGKYSQQSLSYKILDPGYTQKQVGSNFFKDSKLPLVPRRYGNILASSLLHSGQIRSRSPGGRYRNWT